MHATLDLDLDLPVGSVIQSVGVRVDQGADPTAWDLETWLVAITIDASSDDIDESDASAVASTGFLDRYEELRLDFTGRLQPQVTETRTYVVRAQRGNGGSPTDHRLCGAKVVYTEPA